LLVAGAMLIWAGGVSAADSAVSVPIPPGLGPLIREGNGVRELDLPDRLDFLVNGQAVPATGDDAGNCGWGAAARSRWPRLEETGLPAMLGPVGPALRFTSGYLTCKQVADVATGDHWTLACWLRPDDPDCRLTIRRSQAFTGRNETRTFVLSNETACRYHRLNVTANHGAAGVQLSELRLLTVTWGAQ
jgi:hypothetical protein